AAELGGVARHFSRPPAGDVVDGLEDFFRRRVHAEGDAVVLAVHGVLLRNGSSCQLRLRRPRSAARTPRTLAPCPSPRPCATPRPPAGPRDRERCPPLRSRARRRCPAR